MVVFWFDSKVCLLSRLFSDWVLGMCVFVMIRSRLKPRLRGDDRVIKGFIKNQNLMVLKKDDTQGKK